MPASTIFEIVAISVLCVVFGGSLVVGLAKLASSIIGDMFVEAPDWACAFVAGLVGLSASLLGFKITLWLIEWLCFT